MYRTGPHTDVEYWHTERWKGLATRQIDRTDNQTDVEDWHTQRLRRLAIRQMDRTCT